MIEKRWRAWRLSRRISAYQRWENEGAASEDFAAAFDWITGRWSQEMIATSPTWLLETTPHVKPALDRNVQLRIADELASRRVSRSQMEARWSLLIAGASMLIALGSWLVK